MAQKVILIADPGIDTAFAAALAMQDPDLDVVGLVATAGNVDHQQATQNVHVLVAVTDPPRWPRLGAALPIDYEVNGTQMHGVNGLGNADFPGVSLHQPMAGDKVIVDLVRLYPKDVTVVALGPLTVLARAFDRDPELPLLIHRLVCVGGAWHESGNASAVAEFHIYCDPAAAHQVLHARVPTTLIPLDVTRKLVFSPTDLLELPNPESRTCQFLRQIVPFGIRATSNLYGVEGFHLKDVLGVVALAVPGAVSVRPMPVDVEQRGELTRGMTVVDARPNPGNLPNVDLAVGVDLATVREYINRILKLAT
jgi:inosine-uridine nucleoside N-ribohydrolase